jgi:hypothetical protein
MESTGFDILDAELADASSIVVDTDLFNDDVRVSASQAVAPLVTPQSSDAIPAGGKPRKGKFRRQKLPLLRPKEPTVRISADASADRPPRYSFGYCSVSGSFRDYSAADMANVSADRLLIYDNWFGNNEQMLLGCIEGFGAAGAAAAEYVSSTLPSTLEAISQERTKRKRTIAPVATNTDISKLNPLNKTRSAAKTLFDFVATHAKSADIMPPQPKPQKTATQRLTEIAESGLCRTHDMLASGSGVDASLSGVSATIVMLKGHTLIFSGIGGCRAVIGREMDAIDAHAAVSKGSSANIVSGLDGVDSVATRVRRLTGDISATDIRKTTRSTLSQLATGSLDMVYTRTDADEVAALFQPPPTAGSEMRTSSATSVRSARASGSGTPLSSSRSSGMKTARSLSRQLSGLPPKEPLMVVPPVLKPTATVALGTKLEDPMRRRRAILESESMPDFPDLPRQLEQALWFPTDTYRKPSQTVYQFRAGAIEQRRGERSAQLASLAANSSAKPTLSEGGVTLPRRALDALQQANESNDLVDYTVPPGDWDRSRLGRAVKEKFSLLHAEQHRKGINTSRVGIKTPHSLASTDGGASPGFRTTKSTADLANNAIRALNTGFSAMEDTLASRRNQHAAIKEMNTNQVRFPVPDSDQDIDWGAIVEANSSSSRSILQRSLALSKSKSSSSIGRSAALALESGHQLKKIADAAPSPAAKAFAAKTVDVLSASSFSLSLRTQRRPSTDDGARATARVSARSNSMNGDIATFTDPRYYAPDGHPLPVVLPVVLTIDHRPDRPDEAARIVSVGARIHTAVLDGAFSGSMPRVFGALVRAHTVSCISMSPAVTPTYCCRATSQG